MACCYPSMIFVTLSFDLFSCLTERSFLEAYFGKTARDEIEKRHRLSIWGCKLFKMFRRRVRGPFLPGRSAAATEPPQTRFSIVSCRSHCSVFSSLHPDLSLSFLGHGRRAAAMPGADARAPGPRDAQ